VERKIKERVDRWRALQEQALRGEAGSQPPEAKGNPAH
jgi:hypothetical protein